MNPLKILLMGSKELAALNLSDASRLLIYVVYGAIILAFAGAFVRIYKEFGLGKIVQAIREGRDPAKERASSRARAREREKDQFEAWLEGEIQDEEEVMYKLIEDKRYNLSGESGRRAGVLRAILIMYREFRK